MLVYSVYDMVAKFYSPPFFVRTEAQALRAIQTVLRDKEHPFTTSPNDYGLYCIGEWDEQEGLLTSKIDRVCGLATLTEHNQ